MTSTTTARIIDVVKRKYGEIAEQVASGRDGSCCGPSACGCGVADPITGDLYDSGQVRDLPPEALTASLGCGNPTALAELRQGETVLDLGSGGGIDVLLSARRVGPTGKVYGLDMTDKTDKMLALARENQRTAGIENVEFLKGQIEAIPLPDASVDVIISNCVINLSADKDRVLAEAWRVLRPGGRLAAAGFVEIEVEPTRIYRAADAGTFLEQAGFDPHAVAEEVDGAFMSAFVRATRPSSWTSGRHRHA